MLVTVIYGALIVGGLYAVLGKNAPRLINRWNKAMDRAFYSGRFKADPLPEQAYTWWIHFGGWALVAIGLLGLAQAIAR